MPLFLAGLILGIALPSALIVFGPRYGLPVGNLVSASVRNENDQLKARIQGLERQVALAGDARSSSAGDASAGDEEVARLRAQLRLAEDVTSDLQSQLDRAFNSDIPALKAEIEARDVMLKKLDDEVSRLSSLEDQVARSKNQAPKSAPSDLAEIAKLRAGLDQRDALLRKLDDEVSRLSGVESELKALRAERAKSDGASGSVAKSLQAELARAQDAIEKERAKTSAALDQIGKLGDEIASRDSMLQKLDAEVVRLSTYEQQVDELRTRLAEAEKSTNDGRAELQARLDETERTLETTRKSLAERESEIDHLRDENTRLAKTVKPAGENEAKPARKQSTRELTPRDPLRVASAMQDARGLDALGNADRDRIATGLIEGECVTKVLGGVFDKLPALAVRDLIAALESDC